MLYNDSVSYNTSIPYNGPDISSVAIPSGGGGRQVGRFQFPTIVRLRPDVLDEQRRRTRTRLLEEDEELLVILD